MATTYTSNYNLGKQEDKNDNFSMDVITENMDKIDAALSSHELDTNNPHDVTKTQIGLSNVDNTSDLDKPISALTQTALNLKADNLDLTTHTTNTSNPHGVTKAQVGLSNVDNTSDLNKPISSLTQTALDLKADGTIVTAHNTNTSNPHNVTKAQIGLDNVANIDTTTTSNITDSVDKRFVSDAQKAVLDNTSKSVIGELSASILSTEWTGTGPFEDTIPITIAGEQITNTTHDIKVSLVLSSDINIAKQEQEAYSYFSKGEISATNTLKITCFEYKPTVDLNLTLEVVKKWQ